MKLFKQNNLTSIGLVPRIIIHSVLFGFCVLCLFPLLLVISVSFSTEIDLLRGGYKLIPENFTVNAYRIILANPKQLISSYSLTISTTVVGTLLSLLVTSMLAYPLTRRDYAYRKFTTFYVLFTMLFGAGLVPWYIWIVNGLGMKDNYWVLILPYTVNAFHVLLMKGFLSNIPGEMIESAKIDGASEFAIFAKMIIPLSKPGLATIGLFVALIYWNDWWLSLNFITRNDLQTIQFLLYRIFNNIQFLARAINLGISTSILPSEMPEQSARMAMAVLAAGPMLFAFPFFQKYFVKGLTIGSIKG